MQYLDLGPIYCSRRELKAQHPHTRARPPKVEDKVKMRREVGDIFPGVGGRGGNMVVHTRMHPSKRHSWEQRSQTDKHVHQHRHDGVYFTN